MTVFAILMVKDEADVIVDTVTYLLSQVDHVIVSDNGSTDGTRDLLNSMPITVLDDPDPAYRQSQKMSALAALAAERGADWVVPVDADELWSHPTMSLSGYLSALPDDRSIARAALYDYVATGYDDPDIESPMQRIQWRRNKPAPLQKVACRPSIPVVIEQGNHGAHYNNTLPPVDGLVIRHFPYRSAKQMTRKVANGWQGLNAAPELPYSSGQHWRDYGALEAANPGAIADVFYQWFYVDNPAHPKAELVHDPYDIQTPN